MEETKEPKQDETIFTASDFSLQKYDKHVKDARTALYVASGLLLLGGVIASLRISGETLLDIWIEVVVMAGIFLVLGMWSNIKPFSALLTGLIVYVLYQLLYLVLVPESFLKGIWVKFIIVIALVRGMNNAREAQKWKNAIKKD